jgi:hypothetical protein
MFLSFKIIYVHQFANGNSPYWLWHWHCALHFRNSPVRQCIQYSCLLVHFKATHLIHSWREREGKNTLHWYHLLGKVSGPLSSVWKEWVKWCVEFGIEANAIIAVPYDWRLPPSILEERDLYFHKLKFVTFTSTCYEATKFHTSDRV